MELHNKPDREKRVLDLRSSITLKYQPYVRFSRLPRESSLFDSVVQSAI
ncbi:hypothetical protein ACFLXY_04140 [Chloroflexota bacterium]